MKKGEILRKDYKFKGKAFNVLEYSIKLDNKDIKRDIIERNDGVVIVPLDDNNNVIMLSEYCAGTNSYILSLPGGKVEDNYKNIEQEAQRELIEETGLMAKRLKKLFFTYEHPSTSNRKIYVYLGRNLEKATLPNEDEFINIEKYPIETAIRKCTEDFISDISTIAILSKVKEIISNKEI